TPAQTSTDMSATYVPVPTGFLAMTGATIISDTPSVAGQTAIRTIIFAVNSAQYLAQFPDDQIRPLLGLMKGPIQAYCNQKVIESPPVGA
ncbi:MAG: hypothetical protein ACYDEA_01180, partial [Candidatus Dormibacteria bacterium]